MRRIGALLLCIALPVAVFAADTQNGYKVAYDGGTLADVKTGAGLKLVINATTISFVKGQIRSPDHPCFRYYRDQLWPGCSSAGGSSHRTRRDQPRHRRIDGP